MKQRSTLRRIPENLGAKKISRNQIERINRMLTMQNGKLAHQITSLKAGLAVMCKTAGKPIIIPQKLVDGIVPDFLSVRPVQDDDGVPSLEFSYIIPNAEPKKPDSEKAEK